MGGRSDIVLHIGARDGNKRFDLLLEAFASLGRVHTATLVTIGGRKQLSEAERKMVERLGLEGRVRSLGYVADPNLASWYAKARVVVVPWDAEGFVCHFLRRWQLKRRSSLPTCRLSKKSPGARRTSFAPATRRKPPRR